MKLLIGILAAGMLAAYVVTPSAVAVGPVACKQGLVGQPGDNEVARGADIARSWGFTPVGWSWGSAHRINARRLVVWIRYRDFRGAVMQRRGWCNDGNGNGRVTSSEDRVE